ncbi:MAG: Dabb family protein [Candidatus Fermentibacteraceae bacterium]|nr:Dabb family protein [Candidatus Fermentibacteraceae bacterium]MBN2608603.1 Dabb family protein [Candidatus Fermentibacteraceae bacterium]
MIKHIVMWRIDKAPAESMSRTIPDLKKMLLKLGGSVPSVLHAEVGIEEGLPPTMVLYMEFRDRAGLEEYSIHPEHLAAVTELRKHTTKLGSVDYETGKKRGNRRFNIHRDKTKQNGN